MVSSTSQTLKIILEYRVFYNIETEAASNSTSQLVEGQNPLSAFQSQSIIIIIIII